MAMCPLTTSTTNSCEGAKRGDSVSGDDRARPFSLSLAPREESTAPAVAIAQTAAAMSIWTKLRLSHPNIGAMARGTRRAQTEVCADTDPTGSRSRRTNTDHFGGLHWSPFEPDA